jgi:hypothetical protein
LNRLCCVIRVGHASDRKRGEHRASDWIDLQDYVPQGCGNRTVPTGMPDTALVGRLGARDEMLMTLYGQLTQLSMLIFIKYSRKNSRYLSNTDVLRKTRYSVMSRRYANDDICFANLHTIRPLL